MMRSLLPALLFLLPCAVEAQKASYKLTSPVSGCGNVGLSNLNLPKIGSVFKLRVPLSFWTCCKNGKYYVVTVLLATGVTNPKLVIPGYIGVIRTSAEIWQVMPTNVVPFRLTTVSFSIPNSTVLLGVNFYQQSGVFWSSQRFLCRGGHGVIGW